MSYVEGFVAAVPAANQAQYLEHARQASPVFRKHGASRVVEAWGDDVPHGQSTDFYQAVKAQGDEVIVFSWIEWPDKASRDAGMPKAMAELTQTMAAVPMPFDGKRMIFGGFQTLLDDAG